MESCLPWDLIAEILCRLPVKSLVRFRCVSKRWRSEISSPDFIRLHLERSAHDGAGSSIVIVEGGALNHVDLSNPFHVVRDYWDILFCRRYRLVGICDGLVCLLYSDQVGTGLWNMSTGEHLRLPPRPDLGYLGTPAVLATPLLGFGYDPINDDYKVIVIYQTLAKDFDHDAASYSLRSKSWRVVPGFRGWLCVGFGKRGVCVNGAIHWLGTFLLGDGVSDHDQPSPNAFSVAIDLGTFKQRILLLPRKDGGGNANYSVSNLGVLGGNLCAVGSFYWRDYSDIWVMNKYGAKDSWTCLFTIPLISFENDHLAQIAQPFMYSKNDHLSQNPQPLMYSKNGEEVLVGGDILYYYNLKTRQIRHVDIPILRISDDFQICHQSLVSLK